MSVPNIFPTVIFCVTFELVNSIHVIDNVRKCTSSLVKIDTPDMITSIKVCFSDETCADE